MESKTLSSACDDRRGWESEVQAILPDAESRTKGVWWPGCLKQSTKTCVRKWDSMPMEFDLRN